MIRVLLNTLPYLVLAAMIGLRIWDPLPLQHMRLLVFDIYQRLEPRIYDERMPVKIVDVDDDSLARVGQWPWPRSVIAKMVEHLAQAGAAAIAFDIVFAEPDRSSPENVLPLWPSTPEVLALRENVGKLPSHDKILATAIRGAPVITGFVLTEGGTGSTSDNDADAAEIMVADGRRIPLPTATFALAGDDPRPFLPPFANAVPSLSIIEAQGAGNGALNSIPDIDQVVRRVPLVFRLGKELYPSLSAEALRVAQGAKSNFIKSSGASGVLSFGEETGLNAIRVGEFVIPTDANGRLWVRFTEHEPKRYIPAWKIITGDFDPAMVTGQLVFIGTSAPGLHDIRATPLNPSIPGVEIHAMAVEQILTGDFLLRPGFANAVELAFLLVIGTLLIVLLPRYGAVPSVIIGLVAVVVVIVGSFYLYRDYDWMLDPVQPSIMIVFVFLTAEAISFIRSETDRQQVRSAFKHYLSPELVDQLARQPDRLRLGGEQRLMSVMFCDVRGFTAISEHYKDDPQGLTTFLNRFLTPMTDVILRSHGTIDKYIGDAIMAFWNAPLEDPDHAENACRAVLGMYQALHLLNSEFENKGVLSSDGTTDQTPDDAADGSVGRSAFDDLLDDAEKGIVKAQYAAAKAYRDGNGVDRDTTRAAHWFERAARQGYVPAERNIGLRYAHGDGVNRNAEEAFFWLSLAASNDLSGFEEDLEACLDEIDRTVRQEIETRVNIWKPQPEGGHAIRLDIGIGVNSGECVVGNLGSDQRFDYSVLGDSVNLASRLEGQTKAYGVPIMISEGTHSLAPQFAALELDLIAVKGKLEPTRIFALLGSPEMAATDDFKTLLAAHTQFLKAYRAQDWPGAQAQMATCRVLDQNLSNLYDMYEDRIHGLEQDPPGDGWDGVYVALTK
jgi:adenylate cyclase